MKKKTLVKVAEELNRILFDPSDTQEIDVEADEEELKRQILEGARLLTPDDEVSRWTLRKIWLLNVESTKTKKEA